MIRRGVLFINLVISVSIILIAGCENGTGLVDTVEIPVTEDLPGSVLIDTVSIFSGNGVCGGIDSLVSVRAACGQAFISALIGGGSDSVSCSCEKAGDPDSPSLAITTHSREDSTAEFLTYFELPAGFTDVHLILSVIADDAAQIFLNGIFIDQIDLYSPSEPGVREIWEFDIDDEDLFAEGINTLLFKVMNTGTGYYGVPAARADSSDCMYLEFWGVYTSHVEDSCHVVIDIKPGSDRNPVNCKKMNGVIPVAILSTGCFDATEVNHTTVKFGPLGASEEHFNKYGMKRHEEDVDLDGDIDLVFHFRGYKTGIAYGDTIATLSGWTYGGVYFEASDRIITVPWHLDGGDSTWCDK